MVTLSIEKITGYILVTCLMHVSKLLPLIRTYTKLPSHGSGVKSRMLNCPKSRMSIVPSLFLSR